MGFFSVGRRRAQKKEAKITESSVGFEYIVKKKTIRVNGRKSVGEGH